MSFAQRGWLKFCLMGVLMTNSVCWAGFERIGLGNYHLGALSWMFRKTKIPWDRLFQASVGRVLERHGEFSLHHEASRVVLATLWAKQGKHPEAIELLETFLARYPQNPNALGLLNKLQAGFVDQFDEFAEDDMDSEASPPFDRPPLLTSPQ